MSNLSTSLELNPLVEAIAPSKTLLITGQAKAMKRQGLPVVSLSAGEPDFNTPTPIAEAGIQAIREGFTHYTENAGIPELREAISEKLLRDNGLSYAPEQILCSNGAKQSVAQSVLVLCRPGDEVIIPAPYWVSYPEMVKLAGGKPVIVPTTAANGYRMTPEQLEAAITERTRLLILCSPSNPTGSVYTAEELEALAEVLRRHEQVWVISDEIYEYILYEATHTSFATLPGMYERTVTVNGFSKAYAMTGWRLGYLAAPLAITRAAAKLQSQFTSGPSSISQKAGLAALNMGREPVKTMVQAFRERRDFLLEALGQIDGLVVPRPEGAFYVFPDVSAYLNTCTPEGTFIATSEDLSVYLLQKHLVALVPGTAFGDPRGIRFSYAASLEEVAEGVRRFAQGLEQLQRK